MGRYGSCLTGAGAKASYETGEFSMRDSTIRGLRTFCVAARHKSFKRAAHELCVTPSAVSHQIRDLEELIGVPLFLREARGIELTEPGASLASQVSPVLESLDEVLSKFVDRSRVSRALRISLPQFFASELFVPALREFTDANAGLEIRVDTTAGGSGQSRAFDAAVQLLSEVPEDLAAFPLFPLHLVPACSRELARGLDLTDPSATGDTTLIVHESRPSAWHDWFVQAGCDAPLGRVVYLDSMFAVARAAERGLGVALVPIPLSSGWFRTGALVRLSERALETPDSYYFVHRVDDDANEDIRRLRDWMLSRFATAAGGCSREAPASQRDRCQEA